MVLFIGLVIELDSKSNFLKLFKYSLQPRLTCVNYRTLHGLPGKAMSAGAKHSESEHDTEESHVLSEQDNKEFPDATAKELEALIVQERTNLNEAPQKIKLISLRKKLKEFQKETLEEQCKLNWDAGSSKTRSKAVLRKNKHKEVSSRDLCEFEDSSQAVEKRLSKMSLASPTSAVAADKSTSSEVSNDKALFAERQSRKKRR